ncbi:Dilute domain-containing protein C25B8.08 [Exophiala dermatitidis]
MDTIQDPASPAESVSSSRKLPNDLPTSLDDRRTVPVFGEEIEIYDGWQGASQYITAPTPAKPITFDLHLDTPAYDDAETYARIQDSDSRLMEMVAAQAHHREDGSPGQDEDVVATDDNLSVEQKKEILQKSLNMAASNGEVARIQKLVGGRAKEFVDVNLPDEEGTVPLIYASCFGHYEVVAALLDAGAVVDKQDRNQWSALMWAMTNRHKQIAKLLLDHGANPDIKSSSGGTALDFLQPGSDLSHYLHENGYHFGTSILGGDDFYHEGFSQERFEEEMAENEMKRRMLMQESAANLEVDLSTLGFDEQPESPIDFEAEEEFIWDRCVGDQMFVFQVDKLDAIFDLIITNMTPQRSPSQKPVPANLIFLMARYAHYHMTASLLDEVLTKAMDLINDVIERHQWDMTMLAFWISNATLLLHYLKKDAGLVEPTAKYQLELAELINEIYILIIRDAERRMNKILDVAILDHETIPGLEDVAFQGEWKMFKSKPKTKEDPPEKRFRPPSPKRRAQTSPRNITSLLSSTLFVLDLYDVHSVITAQILSQLLYWIGAELFNRVMNTKKYLSRTKAMQIRMNVSAIEDWARANNRQPEHYENGSTVSTGENTVDAARRHLAPIIQLLQWLQCFSSLGEDHESLVATLVQLQRLSPTQLIHAVKNYRAEVGEKSLPKAHMKFLVQLQKGEQSLIDRRPLSPLVDSGPGTGTATPTQTPAPAQDNNNGTAAAEKEKQQSPTSPHQDQGGRGDERSSVATLPDLDNDPPVRRNALNLDQSLMLPFSLPTSTDMLITYGAGIGGVNRERARKYIPTIPTDVLSKLNLDGEGGGGSGVGRLRAGSVGVNSAGRVYSGKMLPMTATLT